MLTSRDVDAPLLALLREVVSSRIVGVAARQIKVSATPANVDRVGLRYGGGAHDGLPAAVIVKRIAPDWPDDVFGHLRECYYYDQIAPHLDRLHPHVYYAGPAPDDEHNLIILQDLGRSHRFLPPNHVWTQSEMEPILRAYARLHVQGAPLLAALQRSDWLFPRYELRVERFCDQLAELAAAVTRRGLWPQLPRLVRLIERTLADIERYADLPVTLLHNDIYPPNHALPREEGEETVRLIDWEMAGTGLAEADLAYMFCQPFSSERYIDRPAALAYYWRERLALEGEIAPADVRRRRQRHADRVLILWLIPVAARVAGGGYPPGSAPRRYWDAMFAVLGERLIGLCNEL